MKRLISTKVAGNILLIAYGLVAIFHLLVLFGVAPSNIVWGGQIGESPTSLLALEITALLVSLLAAAIIAAKIGYIKTDRFKRTITVCLWINFAFLLLNTVGNLASGALIEKLIFTPVTLILAFCVLRLAVER